jgi:ribosomal protein S15P/S13E
MAKEKEKKKVKKTGKSKSKKDIKKKIVELGKKGLTAEKIGLELKKEGFNTEKVKIGRVLKEAKLWKSPDKLNIEKKVEDLRKHFQNNPHDYPSKQSLIEKSSYLRKIKKK